jgi:GNAT superfamily N-acetyltransferase
MYRITRTDDVDEVLELHTLTFPLDEWIGDDRDFWIVRDKDGQGVAFAAAMYQPTTNVVSLDRVGVLPLAQGAGLQRKLVRARLRWARRLGAACCITYISQRNYQSMVTLLKCGFRFYTPERMGEYEHEDSFHFLRKDF